MCLSIAVHSPETVLASGTHAGHDFMVVHNTIGYRCGYVRVGIGHPWHGLHYDDVLGADGDSPSVHGGLTFSEPDVDCGKGGADSGHWLGFDCAHSGDAKDPTLPGGREPVSLDFSLLNMLGSPLSGGLSAGRDEHLWTTEEVIAECKRLCEQAAAVAAEAVTP